MAFCYLCGSLSLIVQQIAVEPFPVDSDIPFQCFPILTATIWTNRVI